MDDNSGRLRRAGMVVALACALTAFGCRSATMAQRRTPTDSVKSADERHSVPGLANLGSAAPAELDPAKTTILQVADQTTTDSLVNSSANLMRLTTRQAIETALVQNPDLVALRQTEGVSAAALGVAETYPFNPWVQVQATPYQDARVGGSGTTAHYVLVMQQIQLAHQQQHREEAAGAALNGVRWNLLQAELLNIAQTQRLYFAAVYQQGLRDLARVIADNNAQLLTILERQLAAGAATAADVAMVRMDARSTRRQRQLAETNLQTALLDLRRHLGLSPDAEIALDDEAFRWEWVVTTKEHLTALSATRPDVLAAHADIDAARANTNLACAARTPDLQIGPFYATNEGGTNFLGFRAQMDLPVINNGMPLVRQREAELNQRAMTWQQLQLRAGLEAQAAADRYERARQLWTEPNEKDAANLPIELQRLEEQFKAGEVDVLRVLQARSSLIQNRRADLDVLNELLQAATAVTASTGVPLESLTTAK